MQVQQQHHKEENTTASANGAPDDIILGVSVHHLKHIFLEQEILGTAGLSRNSSIYEIEDLKGPPGVIRRRGIDRLCPLDGGLGAAYIDCLSGEDHVGPANFMLSYSWAYSVGDIVETLMDYCQGHNLDPKRTYIWMCCLAINQHRVVGQSSEAKSGILTNTTVDFTAIFSGRVRSIGHTLAMMSPWMEPVYLKRIWCIFELYTAHTSTGSKVEIIMPPMQKAYFESDLDNTDTLFAARANTMVQNAVASVPEDAATILQIIESTIGYGDLNNTVNDLLEGWVQSVFAGQLHSRENTADEPYATFCRKIGKIQLANGNIETALELFKVSLKISQAKSGKNSVSAAASFGCIGEALTAEENYDEALLELNKCLGIQEAILGKKHKETAQTYRNMGTVLSARGDFDDALFEYRRCLALGGSIFGENHPYTADVYKSIGSILASLGDHDGAIKNYQEWMAINEAILGPEHPGTTEIYLKIADVLGAQGNYAGALDQYKKLVASQKLMLRKQHPDLAKSFAKMGNVLCVLGDHAGALEQFQKCLAIREVNFGADSLSTADAYYHIGRVLSAQRDHNGALEHFRKCLCVRETCLGKDHLSTANIRREIRAVLIFQRDHDGISHQVQDSTGTQK